MSKDKGEQKAAKAKGLAQYQRVRANVPLRRRMLLWFILAAIVVFAVSVVDILFLDDLLFWGVVGAYVLLFLWAVILFFARTIPEEEWHLQKAALRCTHCKNIFSFSEEHYHTDGSTMLTCPICGEASHLPPPDQQAVVLPIPHQPDHRAAYQCENCNERFLIGTFKKEPRGVRFSECPNCEVSGFIRRLKQVAKLEEQPVLGTMSQEEPPEEGKAEFTVGKASAS